jgi:hypothetical protein
MSKIIKLEKLKNNKLKQWSWKIKRGFKKIFWTNTKIRLKNLINKLRIWYTFKIVKRRSYVK